MTRPNEQQLSQLVGDIRNAYMAAPDKGPESVTAMLEKRLAGLPGDDARAVVEAMIARFMPAQNGQMETVADKEVLTRVFGLILGRRVTPEDLSSSELLARLAQSLNTIFDALNQLISVINLTFSGSADQGEQTIRQFIGFHLEGEDQTKSLEDYLGQINKAFLTTQEAFKKAALSKVAQIIQALDTEKLAEERSGGLKIGPLRKAEDFDILKEKIDRIRQWFDSGRFMEDYLREFEKNCQEFKRK